MNIKRTAMISLGVATVVSVSGLVFPTARHLLAGSGGRKQLGPLFSYQILATSPEAPEALRFFTRP